MLLDPQDVPQRTETWTKNRGIGVKGSKENYCANREWNKRKEAGRVRRRFYFKDGGETIETITEEEQQI